MPRKKSVAVTKHEGCSSTRFAELWACFGFTFFEKTTHISSQEAMKNEGIDSPQSVIFSGSVEIIGFGSPAVSYV